MFNSYAFIFAFLPVTFAVYFLIPKFGKWGGIRHKNRNSSFELLRIFSIFGIISMHLSGGFLENATGICLLYLLIINPIFDI